MRKSIFATPLQREREKRNVVKMEARSLSCRQIGVDENAPYVTGNDVSEQSGACGKQVRSRLRRGEKMEENVAKIKIVKIYWVP